MTRFEVRPVISQTAPESWSYTLILSDSVFHLDPSKAPVWVIAIVLSGPDVSEKGPLLIDTLSNTYQSIELKTPESLYQSLKTFSEAESDSAVTFGAICFTPTQATIMGVGNFTTQVQRKGQTNLVLSGQDQTWKVVEGKWFETDRWCIAAGEVTETTISDLLHHQDSQVAVETLQTQIAGSPPSKLAAVLINASLEVEKGDEDEPLPTPIVIAKPETINKRRILALGLAVLVLLIISVWFGSKARVEKQLAASFTGLEAEANQQIVVATTLQSVDQIKARQTLRELSDKVAAARTTFEANPKWNTKWAELNTRVTSTYQQLAGEAAVENLPEWFALSVVKPGLMGDQLVVAGDNMIMLDKASNTLVKIGIGTKRADILAGGDILKNMRNVAVEGSRAIVTTDTGVEEISLTRKTTAKLIAKDETWQQLTGIAVFNGNIYLLDSGSGDIWRYSAVTAGVGAKSRWLGEGVTLASGTSKELNVDGDLWLLQENGSIKRFRRGAPLNFTLSGLDTPLSNSTALTVSSEQDMLVVLDQGNQRIVAFDKQGAYKKQVKWTGFATAKSISLSADGKTVYILKDGSIYTANW